MKRSFILVTILMALIIGAVVSAHAQQVGQSFNFKDVSLSPTDIDIFADNNGTLVYVTTVNSSGGHFIYDPTSNYKFVLAPTIANTYGASPQGVITFITDNPELSAIILVIIILVAIAAILLVFVLILVWRRK